MIIFPTEKRFDWSNPPFTLLFLILFNVVIFFFYQFSDDEKLDFAFGLYQQEQLLDIEWQAYQVFLEEKKQNERLVEYQQLYQDEHFGSLATYILYDQPFYQYLQDHSAEIFAPDYLSRWQMIREQIADSIFSTSSLRFGLIPSRLNPVNTITYQFLHGGLMHLLGNMFFLVVCGFAVESAIGHGRFLLFYLLSGVAGGLLHSVSELQSITPLIGASGSISGVMAMYLVVFNMRKIEFFYWFYVFVGYFRAPALFILPFYIGKELFDYFSPGTSNVGYLAHAGGFVFGALQTGLLVLLKPDLLNQEYIEEDQSVDPKQEQLDVIYKALKNFHFPRALKGLNEYLDESPGSFELQRLKHRLLEALKGKDLHSHVLQVLSMKNLTDKEISHQCQIFDAYSDLYAQLKTPQLAGLGISFCKLDDISTAERIFNMLREKEGDNNTLATFAKKLSQHFQGKGNKNKISYYDSLAETFLEGSG